MTNKLLAKEINNALARSLLEGALLQDLERWIQYIDSARRFGTPINQSGFVELKTLLEKALQALEGIEHVSSRG